MTDLEKQAREVLERAQTAWKRFFYPAREDFIESCGCLSATKVPLQVADSLREVLNTVSGRELTADPTHISSLAFRDAQPGAEIGETQIDSLSAMLDHDIQRSGNLESFMIRAGLLRDILDELYKRRALSTPHLPERLDREAVASDVDSIVTALYRRFKDWSRRGFGPDDVTWCEVKADVLRLMATGAPERSEDGLREERDRLREALEDAQRHLGHIEHRLREKSYRDARMIAEAARTSARAALAEPQGEGK